MKKILFSLVVLLSIAGCENEKEGRENISNYICNTQQLTLIKEEMHLCKDTGYGNSYCYRQFRKAYCLTKPKRINR